MRPAWALPVLWLAAAAAAATAGRDCVPRSAATVPLWPCYWMVTQSREYVECRDFGSGRASGTVRLLLAGGASGRDPATNKKHCVLLESFIRDDTYGCQERLWFRNFTVGWVRFATGAVTKGCRDCLLEIHLLEAVCSLKQFQYRSSADEFWDFSDPVFNAETGSLISIEFNAIAVKKIPCKISLANIQYLGNTSVEKFRLLRNENSSTDLKLGMMPKMQDFRIKNAYIGKFPEDADVLMPNVELLSLLYTGLEAVPAVAGMKRLETLELSGSRLGRLAGQLPALPSLVELALDDAGLCCLSEDQQVFAGLPQLEYLAISQNNLTSLGSALSPLHNLEWLNAQNNSLTEYPQLDIRKAAVIELQHNLLQTLPDCVHLSHNDSVLDVRISNNQITSWDGHPDMLRCVSKLDLSNNAVSLLNSNMLRMLDRLELVDLGGNPLQCEGCPLVELQEWLRRTTVDVRAGRLDGAAAQLQCAGPPNMVGLSVGVAPSDPKDCGTSTPEAEGPPQVALALSLGLAAMASLVLVGVAVCYRYRFELTYSLHLLRLRLRARTTDRTGGGDAGSSFLYDAFILYSNGDRQWVVETLVPLLENGPQRYRVCLHERDFQLGTVIVQNISQSMDRSRHTIVVLSRNFVTSKWCMWEMDLANHRTLDPSQREFIILLELEPLERSALPRHVRFLMDTRTLLQWRLAAGSDHHQQALRALKKALGPSLFPHSATTRC